LKWDEPMLKELNIPKSILPEVKPSANLFGTWRADNTEIPITGVAGDQQAALFGQACFEPGMAKNTYGTGCFMLMNTGTTIQQSKNGLITTIAWGLDGKVEYALEGSVFIAGAAVQWLRDSLHLIDQSKDSEYFATKGIRLKRSLCSACLCGIRSTVLGHVCTRSNIWINTRYR
jgi:glycerol kinase